MHFRGEEAFCGSEDFLRVACQCGDRPGAETQFGVETSFSALVPPVVPAAVARPPPAAGAAPGPVWSGHRPSGTPHPRTGLGGPASGLMHIPWDLFITVPE